MRLRKALRKIHRWVGLLASVWLLQLAVTGLLLQFATQWNLTNSYVKSPMILQWFDYGKRLQAFDTGQQSIYQVDDVLVIKDQKHQTPAIIVSAHMWQDQWLVATENTLSLYEQNGDLSNQWDDFDGLPIPINTLGSNQYAMYLQSRSQWFEINLNGEFQPVNGQKLEPAAAVRTTLNSAEKERLFTEVLSDKLSFDKVVHGVHSAMKGSVWLNTLSALALIYLCISGIYMFFKAPNKNKQRK
ncbi:MAG: PepSY domain-containing protein [Xanthomonadales bacterium]|nr:PepSY domain-containing protein [Xanthomonadales bacterium]